MIVDAEERTEAFDLLVRSGPWQLLVEQIVLPAARRARGVLLNSKNIEEIREAQAELSLLKRVIEYPYKEGADEKTIPRQLSMLWDA